MTLVLAGHETTANAMAWAHHLLAENPGVYDDLQAEARTVLGDRPPSLEDLPRLPLSLQVMKEAMRLFPPAYVVARAAIEDVTIGDFEIAKDTIVAVNIYGMHRRGDYFPDPLRLRPERFAPENEKHLKKGAFLPFGGGPRICIGNHLALTEGQIILSTLAARVRMRRTRLTPVRGEPLVTLRPRGGLRMRAACNESPTGAHSAPARSSAARAGRRARAGDEPLKKAAIARVWGMSDRHRSLKRPDRSAREGREIARRACYMRPRAPSF
jgi:cytochrome P450